MSLSKKQIRKGLKAADKDGTKEPLDLKPLGNVRVTNADEETWFRIENFPGYVVSSHERYGRIVSRGRWTNVRILKPDHKLYGNVMPLYRDGEKHSYRLMSALKVMGEELATEPSAAAKPWWKQSAEPTAPTTPARLPDPAPPAPPTREQLLRQRATVEQSEYAEFVKRGQIRAIDEQIKALEVGG